jgi:NADPH:quinone reductase-like Zn-dependent oxidoreductase
MREVVIPRIGGPEVLQLRERPDPEPSAGEVRIRVRASGLNFADVMARMGLYPDAPPLPTVVGYEIAGEVDAVGPGVTEWRSGARVIGLCRFGGHADVVVLPEAQVFALPDGLSFEQGAAIPVNYLTAWLMLVELGNLQARHTVLVHSAGGGVGQAAVQICRLHGATVLGTASAGKHERLREGGVAACLDLGAGDLAAFVREQTGGRGVDIALDAAGGRSFRRSYDVLAPMGRLFLFGASSFAPGERRSIIAALRGLVGMPRFGPIDLMNRNRGVFGINLGHLWSEQAALGEAMAAIVRHAVGGELRPVIDSTVPMAEAARAHERLQSRQSFGKVLLVP